MSPCSAYGCTNRTSKKIPGITFHRFPANKELKQKWVRAVRRKNWKPSRSSCLCSEHFRPDQFDRYSYFRVRLVENAVPSIFCFSKDVPKRAKCVEENKPTISNAQLNQADDFINDTSHVDVLKSFVQSEDDEVDEDEEAEVPKLAKSVKGSNLTLSETQPNQVDVVIENASPVNVPECYVQSESYDEVESDEEEVPNITYVQGDELVISRSEPAETDYIIEDTSHMDMPDSYAHLENYDEVENDEKVPNTITHMQEDEFLISQSEPDETDDVIEDTSYTDMPEFCLQSDDDDDEVEKSQIFQSEPAPVYNVTNHQENVSVKNPAQNHSVSTTSCTFLNELAYCKSDHIKKLVRKNEKIHMYRKKIKSLTRTMRRQDRKLKNLKSVLSCLQDENLADDDLGLIEALNKIVKANKEFLVLELSQMTEIK